MAQNPGCEAIHIDTGHEAAVIPVCMGGVAIEGAMASIVYCNNPSQCGLAYERLTGFTPIVVNGRVTGEKLAAKPVGARDSVPKRVLPLGIQVPLITDILASGLWA